jgi:hypothetical protein
VLKTDRGDRIAVESGGTTAARRTLARPRVRAA